LRSQSFKMTGFCDRISSSLLFAKQKKGVEEFSTQEFEMEFFLFARRAL
jgi:hypothetical protein